MLNEQDIARARVKLATLSPDQAVKSLINDGYNLWDAWLIVVAANILEGDKYRGTESR